MPFTVPLSPPSWSIRPRAWLVALFSVALFLLLKLVLDSWVAQAEIPFLLLSAPIIITAWYGGFAPGIISLILCVLVGYFFFLPAEDTVLRQPSEPLLKIVLFTFQGGLICLLCEQLHQARSLVRKSDLKAQVALEKSLQREKDLASAEARILASNLRFRRLVDANIIGVYVCDPSGRLTEANQRFLQMLGLTEDAIREREVRPRHLTSEEFAGADEAASQAIVERGRCDPYEKQFVRADGQRIPAMIGSARLDEDGATISFALDLSAQKETESQLNQAKEEAIAANRSKSDFLANISHELRTPLNAIIGMTELALDEQISESAVDHLKTVRDSGKVLLHLINEILDYSRMESGNLELTEKDFDLQLVLDDTIRGLALQASEKGLELTCHLVSHVPIHLRGDPVRLRQVLTNLVNNAIKFTDQGSVGVKVRVESIISDEVVLVFEVADTGIGISPENKQQIFAPFNQVDASASRSYGGTGLGLAIAREIVTMTGGRMWVESETGVGSQFFFTMRFHRARQPIPDQVHPLLPELENMEVLVVDDNPTNREILQETLTNWSMKPVVVESGAEALQWIEKTVQEKDKIPLVLLDARMPEMDGFEVVEKMKLYPHFSEATILMLSSVDRQTYRNRCEDLGIDAYLEKPITQSALFDAIVQSLELEPEQEIQPQRSMLSDQTSHPLRILLAEDIPANQKLVQTILQKRGHQVQVASNGQVTLDLWKQQPFDVILMDVQMPVLDGFQATGLIRREEPSQKQRIPIIAMTAHAMRGDRSKCLAAGMDAYIAKPIDAKKLIELVESFPHGRLDAMEETHTPEELSQANDLIFKWRVALERVSGDEVLLLQMRDYFLEDAPQRLTEIEDGWEQGDYEQIRRAAHSLKGLAGNFEAIPARQAAAGLEDLAKHQHSELQRSIAEVREKTQELMSALQAQELTSNGSSSQH